MDLGNSYGHLTYSTLVHPGDTWSDMKNSLVTYVPEVKKRFSPNAPIGSAGLQADEGALQPRSAHDLVSTE